ncbi:MULTISPECIES: hypothetical protein [unclassified Rhizobium]|uniref:hypothetical protein n=1 Tax=unclassified Rhizobium TaxID=2613769 RepID=UPI00247943DF|nr:MULTISPECIES: hypothetical protein [unclassified Rhizobium]MDH7800443.1 hypothetical protein [Rhizobium sp. AN70]
MKILCAVAVFAASILASGHADAQSTCEGKRTREVSGLSSGRITSDGTVLGYSKININIDGYGKAYHPKNAAAGALIHLCNAGQVYLPDGTKYHGSVNNATCTGKFMSDVARIGKAHWKDKSVGVVRWYGILGKDTVSLNGSTVRGVVPVEQADGSGFFVSPTKFADQSIKDEAVQRRYVNPLRIPAAVIPESAILSSNGVVMGSFGVAIRKDTKIAVPFVVGDAGPRIGEGTPALARSLAGLPITDNVTRNNRFAGQVDTADVLWVFFGKKVPAVKYDANNENALISASQKAFAAWGGKQRLDDCLK